MIQELITYGIILIAISFAGYLILQKNFNKKKPDDCNACIGGDKCDGCPLNNIETTKKKK